MVLFLVSVNLRGIQLDFCNVRLSALATAGFFCYHTSMENQESIMQLADFDWKPHPAGFQAVGLFPNNFGCSVIPELDSVTYEVAILRHENGIRSHVDYNSGLTGDVFRCLTVDEVHAVIAQARNLEAGTFVYDEPELISE
jgi:hypothetical protein